MSDSTLLIDAILALANAPDWSARKRVVEQHHELLLSDGAESLLEEGVAKNAGRPRVRERFELCRSILADCRATGVDAAFVLAIGPTPGLLEALQDLVGADSATDAYDSTVEQQGLLLTDEADWVLAALAHESADDKGLVERIAHRRALLSQCREAGIEPAFAGMLREERTTEALEALVPALDSPKEAAAILMRYEDVLLTDDAARSVKEMAAQKDITPDVARAFSAMHSLLTIARADGFSTASATYLLPPFEQFINRCFFALFTGAERELSRRVGITELLESEFDKFGTDFPEKLHQWSQTELKSESQESLH